MPPELIKAICLSPIILGVCGEYSSLTEPSRYTPGEYCRIETSPPHAKLKPLADLLASGEGDYNSVNRGYAGDTPGGIQSITGKNFSAFTVREVISLQRSSVYAVGRYQLIPTTLRFAVKKSGVKPSDYFTGDVQDRLMASLIFHKRPAVGEYLTDEHDDVDMAINAIAREWASVEYTNGRGYYDYQSGNKASITRQSVKQTLIKIKNEWNPDYSPKSQPDGISI